MFGIVLSSVFTVMHVYVWTRVFSTPFLRRRVPKTIRVGTGLVLWGLFMLNRRLRHSDMDVLPAVLEWISMNWLAVLFVTLLPLLITDLVTGFGRLLPRASDALRTGACVIGIVLSLTALVQGHRPPNVERIDIRLPGLPASLDGTVIAALSDLHLGPLLGSGWLEARVDQVRALNPDLVVLIGDIFDEPGHSQDGFTDLLRQISAPLGKWAVPGNHEYYRGIGPELFQAAGFTVLVNRWVQLSPGLVLAGVEDLTIHHRRRSAGDPTITKDPVGQALEGRPPGTSILLSHTPWEIETAAAGGVDLMLSGHTHGGQIWPFGYLVKKRYPFLEGVYQSGRMTVVTGRGAGTWGPRMRLWSPGQILHVTLRRS